MDNGILIAMADDGNFQIVAVVSGYNEAVEMSENYLKHGQNDGDLAPTEFQIHYRNGLGKYTRIQRLPLITL